MAGRDKVVSGGDEVVAVNDKDLAYGRIMLPGLGLWPHNATKGV